MKKSTKRYLFCLLVVPSAFVAMLLLIVALPIEKDSDDYAFILGLTLTVAQVAAVVLVAREKGRNWAYWIIASLFLSGLALLILLLLPHTERRKAVLGQGSAAAGLTGKSAGRELAEFVKNLWEVIYLICRTVVARASKILGITPPTASR